MNQPPALSSVLETCLYVDDLAATERFYGEVLGLEFVSRVEGRHVFFRCGRQMLLLFDPEASGAADSELPPHGSRGGGHVAFSMADEHLDAWMEKLRAAGVEVEQVVEWGDRGRSFYFRDPAGNSLELATPSIWGLSNE